MKKRTTGRFCYVPIMAAAMSALCGCDTRDDYFTEHGEEPTISVGKVSGDDTNYGEGDRYRKVILHWNETASVDIELSDYYGSPFEYEFSVQNTTKEDADGFSIARHYFAKALPYQQETPLDGCFSKYFSVGIDNVKHSGEKTTLRLNFCDNTENGIGDIFPTEESAEKQSGWKTMKTAEAVSFTVNLKSRDKIGLENVFYFRVEIVGNRQPVADFTYSCTDKEAMEYEIDASELCKDPDGDKITHYEYCFSSGTRNFHGDYGKYYANTYKNGVFSSDNLDPHFGEAAPNGDVITPTKINKVRHTFQSKGACVIAVRCRDENLCWSDWTEKRFVIE